MQCLAYVDYDSDPDESTIRYAFFFFFLLFLVRLFIHLLALV